MSWSSSGLQLAMCTASCSDRNFNPTAAALMQASTSIRQCRDTNDRYRPHSTTALRRDARAFAERFARGRLISVLEGGYSDRALTSGALAHLTGLAHTDHTLVDEIWWSEDSLIQVCCLFVLYKFAADSIPSMQLEKATKRHRGGKNSQATQPAPWLERTLEVFAQIDSSHTVPTSSSRAAVPPSSRVLRERQTPAVTEIGRGSSSSPSKESASAREDNSVSGAKGALLKQESQEVHVTSGDSESESKRLHCRTYQGQAQSKRSFLESSCVLVLVQIVLLEPSFATVTRHVSYWLPFGAVRCLIPSTPAKIDLYL